MSLARPVRKAPGVKVVRTASAFDCGPACGILAHVKDGAYVSPARAGRVRNRPRAVPSAPGRPMKTKGARYVLRETWGLPHLPVHSR
jgi:hypothetical protein